MNATVLAVDGNAYLSAYMRPLQLWLEQDDISELLVNGPGEIWIERAGAAAMERHMLPEMDDILMQRLATQIARYSHQGINRERPLLAATLPDGSRIQFIAPPATRAHWVMAIRRHRVAQLPLSAFVAQMPARVIPDPKLINEDRFAYLKAAVAARQTILVSGGTSSGKTSFLNSYQRSFEVTHNWDSQFM